ncbi:EthD family reductase [Cognatishimia sp. F0-27]|uniref:EthD family reductase n=1 Tax=Cognatishimia sp. F0-27 TaxID=2816855 RepID=UPI001D0C12AE|nr:EthD family reductase [Cognatishimia sp. F0-27]MCC1491235.1 EthD family reductase [Cognatishimia sp. F0-27]
MAVTLQVLYPTAGGTKFDHDYYRDTHMALVRTHMGPHIESTLVTKGLAGGPDTPPEFHAVATMVFADQAALGAAMEQAGPVLADIPKFTDTKPQMLIGETI